VGGLAAGSETRATLPADEAILKVFSICNPTQAELDRLLMPIKVAEIAEEEALRRLGELAAAEGTAIEICIYGGTATNSEKWEGS
jgi:hypothetical protein